MSMKGAGDGKVRYAVVGLGNIAQIAVLPSFDHAKANSELVALVSSDAEKLSALSIKYEVPYTGSYDELEATLRDARVGAVYLAVPNAMHRSMTERAAAANVHVLCEKPMATSVTDCEAMVSSTRAAGVKLMIAYRLHFEEANLTAIERVRRGEIGDPLIFSSVFSQQVRTGDIRTRADLGGGAIYDMGIYCINAARYVFRDEPLEVLATQVRDGDPRFVGVDGMTSAILTFSGGRVAQLTASQAAADVDEYRIVGSRGDIRLSPAFAYAGALKELVTVKGSTQEKVYSKRDHFAPELLYFSDCILQGTEPEPSGEEGLCDVRIVEAIETSARTGRLVRLPPFQRAEYPSWKLEMKKPPVGKVEPIHAPSPAR